MQWRRLKSSLPANAQNTSLLARRRAPRMWWLNCARSANSIPRRFRACRSQSRALSNRSPRRNNRSRNRWPNPWHPPRRRRARAGSLRSSRCWRWSRLLLRPRCGSSCPTPAGMIRSKTSRMRIRTWWAPAAARTASMGLSAPRASRNLARRPRFPAWAMGSTTS